LTDRRCQIGCRAHATYRHFEAPGKLGKLPPHVDGNAFTNG
jgi:hypothetical protein